MGEEVLFAKSTSSPNKHPLRKFRLLSKGSKTGRVLTRGYLCDIIYYYRKGGERIEKRWRQKPI